MAPHRILAGSYTNDIYTLSFDPDTPSLSLESSVEAGFHPSWITPYPGDKSIIFTGLESGDGGQVVAIKYDENGRGSVATTVPTSGGKAPCHLSATSDELIVANYVSGDVGFFPIISAPPYITSTEPTSVIKLEGKSVNLDRQESAHAHQAFLTETNELLVPDLGSDKVRRFVKNDIGKWVPNGDISYDAGGGPRHVAISEGHLYTVLELTSELAKHTFSSSPTHIATKPTVSQHSKDMLAAEILIAESNNEYPVPYVYVSNRNDPRPDGDTIAIFSTSPFELVAEIPTGLNHLRGMKFGGENNKWLIAGGANGGGVKVFERTNGGRGLKEVAKNESITAATDFLWL